MEHFFSQIQVQTGAQKHTESNHWRGCRWRPYSNCWKGYSQIIGRISPPGFGTPGGNLRSYATGRNPPTTANQALSSSKRGINQTMQN